MKPAFLDLVDTLKQLVAIPSVNPMGRPMSGPEYLEMRVTAWLEARFRSLGLEFERHTVEPGRDNILARFEGSPTLADGGELILWEAHQDTVPTTGMTIPPWTPSVSGRRLFGRGACDVKGGLAAMLHALARVIHEKPAKRPTIVMASTINEECGFSGATALAQLWKSGSRLLPRAPDAAIVAEPTDLQVVVAHKGVVRWRCHTLGRAAHSSQPERGDNAIYRMGRVLGELEKYAAEVAPHLGSHPRCGSPTLSVGTVSGGLSVNTVPDRCTIEIDRRLIPGEQPRDAYQMVIDHVAKFVGADGVQHDPPFMTGPGLSERLSGPLAERLLAAIRPSCATSTTVGVAYGTNAAAISAAGVPCVVFGPGSIDQAHTADEWIDLDALQQASEILFRFASS